MDREIDYSPLSFEDYQKVNQIVSEVSTNIPPNYINAVWHYHNAILGTNERKPCTCSSAAKHWIRAMETLRNYVKRVNG
jgi:uncharacterized protein YchJ